MSCCSTCITPNFEKNSATTKLVPSKAQDSMGAFLSLFFGLSIWYTNVVLILCIHQLNQLSNYNGKVLAVVPINNKNDK